MRCCGRNLASKGSALNFDWCGDAAGWMGNCRRCSVCDSSWEM